MYLRNKNELSRLRLSTREHYIQTDVRNITMPHSPVHGNDNVTYDVHLGLIGKRVVDFLLVLIEWNNAVTVLCVCRQCTRNVE